MPRHQLRLRPSSARLDRRRPTKEPHKRFLVLCEGEVTERGYFVYLRQNIRSAVITLEIPKEHGVPLSLVQVASDMKRAAEQMARREQDSASLYDQVWCVFDIDRHPNVAQAVDQARANGIRLAISNPCFELWALLHFQERRAYLERHEARALLKAHVPGYDKQLPCDELFFMYPQARQRAVALDNEHTSAGGEVSDNPSSGVWRLVDSVRDAAESIGSVSSGNP